MKPTLNEKLIAYLALFSGLTLSIVAEFYSIAGLTSIFSAAVIPAIIMGIALGIGKIVATVWLKQNWDIAPWSVRIYLASAIVLLMLVTSMGTFGFLSKAHSDQSLVSGDVTAKIAIYDEKIKVSQDNIDVNRKALKQLDEAVDQVMGRSTSETGADKAVAIRKSQTKERTRLLSEIAAEQKVLTSLREERAPIAAEVRKVEAEVGPIKYIAQFVYGDTDPAVLEKAVTWVIILIIVVFDPLAIILLLSSQISFQRFREQEQAEHLPYYVADVGEKPTAEELAEGDSPVKVDDNVIASQPTVTESILEQHPYLTKPFKHFENVEPMVAKPAYEADDGPLTEQQIEQIKESVAPVVITPPVPVSVTVRDESKLVRTKVFPRASVTVPIPEEYVQNEEQKESNLWTSTTQTPITKEEYVAAAQQRAKDNT
jgi:flagellar basal body-associated protein FliL